MTETPKQKPEAQKSEPDERKKGSWSEDQKQREYYYDDAHGYEVYEPDRDDDEDSRSA